MTTVEESSSYTPVEPELGQTASARARAAANPESATAGPLRAQPRAGARARQTVAAAGAKYQQAREHRRAVTAARGSGPAAVEAPRDSVWEIQPPSLAELTRQALAGPTRTLHLPDGKVVEESVDWPDWQVTAWKAWQLLTLVLIGVPGHILLWAEQRPSRFLALLSIVGLAVFLGWYGGEIAATAPEVTP